MPALDTQDSSLQGSLTSSRVRLTNRQWMLAVACVSVLALALRINFVTQAVVDSPIRGDATQYFTAAWNLIHRHVFSITPPHDPVLHGDSYRDPGFPVFLAIWLNLFGNMGFWYEATQIAQASLGAATVLLLTAATRAWLTDRWAIAAGFLMAIWPHSVTICGYLLSETLFAFLCALALYLWSVAIRKQTYRWFIACGLCFSVAGLTNAMLLPFAPMLAITLFWLRHLDRKRALALALASLLLPMAWQVRNAQLPPDNRDAGSRALINVVQGSWPEYHGNWRAAIIARDPAAQPMQAAIMHEYDVLQAHPSAGLAMIWERMAQSPLHYLGWYLRKPMYLWGWDIEVGAGDIYPYPTVNSPFNHNPVLRILVALCAAFNPLLALLAAAGALLILLRRKTIAPLAVATAAVALYATLIYSLLQAEPRYAIPFRGEEILVATWGLACASQWLDQLRSTRRT